jgi:hypothetical protein
MLILNAVARLTGKTVAVDLMNVLDSLGAAALLIKLADLRRAGLLAVLAGLLAVLAGLLAVLAGLMAVLAGLCAV